MQETKHELWLVYKEIEDAQIAENWAGVEEAREKLGKIINTLPNPAAALGSIKSKAKAEAARANGKKGGRPRKK